MTYTVFSVAENRAWLSVILVMSLMIGSCGGGGGGSGGGSPSTGISMDDLGEWGVISGGGNAVGFEHSEYALRVLFDRDGNPTITASSPNHQPTVTGVWSGNWYGRYSLNGYLDRQDSGSARINVTIAGNDVFATLVYSEIDIQGMASSVSFPRASVTDGRFAPRVTLSVPSENRDRVSRTFSGLGQFGGSEQKGVVGYVSAGPVFQSAFYGDRMP